MTSQTPEVTEIEEVVEDFVKGMWYVTGESQYPEGAEKKSYHQGFSDAVAMAYIELTGTPKSKGLINKLLLSQQQKHREELQKARQDWLREEKERTINLFLEEGYLKGRELIPHDESKKSHGTCCYCGTCGHDNDNCVCEHNRLLQTIIDRYQDELEGGLETNKQ